MIGLVCSGIAHVAHAAGESILCREGWRRRSSQITLGRLVIVDVRLGFSSSFSVTQNTHGFGIVNVTDDVNLCD